MQNNLIPRNFLRINAFPGILEFNLGVNFHSKLKIEFLEISNLFVCTEQLNCHLLND